MKKYSEFELIGIGITLLVLCILISIIGKHVFDLDGDYLSAAATLFAAVVAMLLFNDWREPYTITKIDNIQNELRSSIKLFRYAYNDFRYFLLKDDRPETAEKFMAEYKKYEKELLDSIEAIRDHLDRCIILVKEIQKHEFVNDHLLELQLAKNQLNDMYILFMESDPNENFIVASTLISDKVKNGEFNSIAIGIFSFLIRDMETFFSKLLNIK